MLLAIIIGLLVLIVLVMVVRSMNRSLNSTASGINAAADKLGAVAARQHAEIKAGTRSRWGPKWLRILLLVIVVLVVIMWVILLVAVPR